MCCVLCVRWQISEAVHCHAPYIKRVPGLLLMAQLLLPVAESGLTGEISSSYMQAGPFCKV